MSDFSAFLAQNKIKQDNIKFVVSKNFVINGRPIEWELRTLSAGEDEDIRRAATRKVPVAGRKGAYTSELDSNTYLAKMTAASVVYPNLNSTDLQDSYNVKGAENLLRAMLSAGEYVTLSGKVAELNGFDSDTNELVEEAKN